MNRGTRPGSVFLRLRTEKGCLGKGQCTEIYTACNLVEDTSAVTVLVADAGFLFLVHGKAYRMQSILKLPD